MAACRRRVVYRFAQGAGRKVLKMDRPAAGGFLSLTAFQAEGCGGGFAAKFKESTFLSSLVHPDPDLDPRPRQPLYLHLFFPVIFLLQLH